MKKLLAVASIVGFVQSMWSANLSVAAPQEGAAKSVTIGGKASIESVAGATVALKATANKGWAFAGWYSAYDSETGVFSNEVELAKAVDWRTASASLVAGEDDVKIYARFVTAKDDGLLFDLSNQLETDDYSGMPYFEYGKECDIAVAVDSCTLPTVKVTGLPTGLKFDAKTFRITGRPTKPGFYKLNVSAVNVWKYSYSQIVNVLVGNAASEHVEGYNQEADMYYVGDDVDMYLDDLFYISNTNSDVRAVSVTGLPAGLSLETEKWDDGYIDYYIRGTPTKAGSSTVWCKVTFADGTVEEASAIFTISEEQFYEFDVSGLMDHSVGDVIAEQDFVYLGSYDSESNLGVTGVRSLPAGISTFKETDEDGYTTYYLKGSFTKAGEYIVKIDLSLEDEYGANLVKKTVGTPIVVGDVPSEYLSVEVMDADAVPGCTVKGAGVYDVGSVVRLTATAARNHVFAGWYGSDGLPAVSDGIDHRTASMSVSVGGDSCCGEYFARFLANADDGIFIDYLDGESLLLDPNSDEIFMYEFNLESGSLPKLTFKNLPAGMECVQSADAPDSCYQLVYDPSMVKKVPAPGRYRVSVTASNVSKNTDAAEFTVVVANITNANINVLDDYGVLTPNVAMEPISFSNAVDLARGDTLKVAGLPAGLKFNDRNSPYMLTGIPTKPGEYTLTFTAQIVKSAETNASGRVTLKYETATATAFITVKNFPEVRVSLDDDAAVAAGNKVSGSGNHKAGSKVSLRATAAKGWVFAGWSGLDDVNGLAALNPSLSYEVGTNDLYEINASFIELKDDELYVDDAPDGTVVFVKGVPVSTNLIENLIFTRSLPAVKVSGLPSGLRFDAKTFMISGTIASSAKSGVYYITVDAKNAGGYAFVRVLRVAVLDSAEADMPEDQELKNEAEIWFDDLDRLMTGEIYSSEDASSILIDVPSRDSDVKTLSCTGIPKGLSSRVVVDGGEGIIEIYGVPTQPGRFTVKVNVTYEDRSRAVSEYAFIIEDGGSYWLDVLSADEDAGTVSGQGVYASGATVKLSAKAKTGNVFAGWTEDGELPFFAINSSAGVDYRSASVSMPFCISMFTGETPAVYGVFASKDEDSDISVEMSEPDSDGITWEIDPSMDAELEFEVVTDSLPKVTVTGLPKGVSCDVARGLFMYDSSKIGSIIPGYYTVTIKADNQSRASCTRTFTIFVANKVSEAMPDLDPASDAYVVSAGVSLDPSLIMTGLDLADGWNLSAKGLPTGLSLKSEKDPDTDESFYVIVGVPTRTGTNTVTFTATRGKGADAETETATITVCVTGLPAWAVGSFDGAYFAKGTEDDVYAPAGTVSVTVSDQGRISGKIQRGGKSYSFSAASFSMCDSNPGKEDEIAFVAEVEIPWTTTNKRPYSLKVSRSEDGIGMMEMKDASVCCGFIGEGFGDLVQNVWKRKDLGSPAFATGKNQPVYVYDETLQLKFGAGGAVTVSGAVDGVRVSGKAQLLMDSRAEECNAWLPLYLANRSFEGGAWCHVLDLQLMDSDEDGVVDEVVCP